MDRGDVPADTGPVDDHGDDHRGHVGLRSHAVYPLPERDPELAHQLAAADDVGIVRRRLAWGGALGQARHRLAGELSSRGRARGILEPLALPPFQPQRVSQQAH
jgi:hypothetical protein